MQEVSYDLSQCGVVYDAQYDGHGRRLATASADGKVRVWEQGTMIAELKGHQSPVLSVAWGNGRYSAFMASGSEDGHVITWIEARPNDWQMAHQFNVTGAANVVRYSMPDHGFLLAVAGGDDLGVVTVLARRDPQAGASSGQPWQVRAFAAHAGGVSSLSWAPSKSAATMATGPAVGRAVPFAPFRLVTCGVDGLVKVWFCDAKAFEFKQQCELTADAGPCAGLPTSVAWRPNIGLPCHHVVACTDEGQVACWVQDMDGQPWRLGSSWQVPSDARRVAWSWNGTLLSISHGDSGSCLYREGSEGAWEDVTSDSN